AARRAFAGACTSRGGRLLRRGPRAERAGGHVRAGRRAEREPCARLVQPRLRARGRAGRSGGHEPGVAAARVGPPLLPRLLSGSSGPALRLLARDNRTPRASALVTPVAATEPEERLMLVGVDWAGVAQQVVAGLSSGGTYATLAVALVLIYRATGVVNFAQGGLAMRAAALNPESSRLTGIRVSWTIALGWGLATALGAVAGLMAAPPLGSFDQNFMQPILLYAFAGAVLGGIDSALGAVIGSLAL